MRSWVELWTAVCTLPASSFQHRKLIIGMWSVCGCQIFILCLTLLQPPALPWEINEGRGRIGEDTCRTHRLPSNHSISTVRTPLASHSTRPCYTCLYGVPALRLLGRCQYDKWLTSSIPGTAVGGSEPPGAARHPAVRDASMEIPSISLSSVRPPQTLLFCYHHG